MQAHSSLQGEVYVHPFDQEQAWQEGVRHYENKSWGLFPERYIFLLNCTSENKNSRYASVGPVRYLTNPLQFTTTYLVRNQLHHRSLTGQRKCTTERGWNTARVSVQQHVKYVYPECGESRLKCRSTYSTRLLPF